MIDAKTIPAVQTLLEQERVRKEQSAVSPQFVRAPEGNGHEAALKDKR
ncbi:hypothetical protein [Massilia sp. UBA6681]|nr:hypothetical protein [Massilia sp. UBA6681]